MKAGWKDKESHMKYCMLLMFVLGSFACKPSFTGIRIIYLDKLEQKTEADVHGTIGPAWYNFVLVENPPVSKDSLQQLIRDYADSTVNKAAIEAQYVRYFIQFYKLTDNTKGYIKSKVDFWDVHNDIKQEDAEYLGEYRYERCGADSLHGAWLMHAQVGPAYYTDTIVDKCKL